MGPTSTVHSERRGRFVVIRQSSSHDPIPKLPSLLPTGLLPHESDTEPRRRRRHASKNPSASKREAETSVPRATRARPDGMESLILASCCSASPRLPLLSSAARFRGLPVSVPPPSSASISGAARKGPMRPRLFVAAAAAPRGSGNGEGISLPLLMHFRFLIARCSASLGVEQDHASSELL